MADLSKIKLNGTEYNLKDTEARESIPTKTSELTNDSNFAINSNIGIGYVASNNLVYVPKGVNDAAVQSFLIYNSSNIVLSSTITLKSMVNDNVIVSNAGVYVFSLINAYNAWSTEVRTNRSLTWGTYLCHLSDNTISFYYLDASFPQYVINQLKTKISSDDANSLIASAIGDINSFEVSIVASLPTESIDTHTIYFMANNSSGDSIYDEYMYINNNWEKIGSTAIDLSGYLQTTDIADWAKAATKPTYTANEVGALPSTYTAPVTSVNGQTGAVTLSIPSTTTITNTLSSGTLIATINGTDIYAPAYTDADGVSY